MGSFLRGGQTILLLACAAAAAACSDSATAEGNSRERPPLAIQTETVKRDDVRRTVEVVGTLAAENEVTVSSEVEGIVSRIPADLGDRVRAGQVLVELDREKLEYSLDQQRAALARSLASYGGNEPASLPSIEQTPDVKRAAAEMTQAKQAYDRAAELHKRELVSRQTLDDADAILRAKQAGYDLALQSARNLAADIDASRASVKLAELQVRDASIRAPFDGYVQKRLVSLGELVKAQMPVMSVVRVDPLKVTAELPEAMGPWVQTDQPVTLQVDAYPGRTFTGKVSRISPSVNTQTRAFPFESLVPNAEGLLKPGTFARVQLATSRVAPVLTVPYAALQYRYGVNRAFVVTGDHLVGREVKVGDRLGERMEIEGLAEGDRVAMTNVDNLADGMKVTVQAAVD